MQFVEELGGSLTWTFELWFGFFIVPAKVKVGHVSGQYSRIVSDFGRVEYVAIGSFGRITRIVLFVGGYPFDGGEITFVEFVGHSGTGVVVTNDETFGLGDLVGCGVIGIGGNGGNG